MNEYSKIIGYKIYTQKSVAFVYTNNELLGREIKETISFIITSKRIRYLGIKLPKEAKTCAWKAIIRYCWKKLKTTQSDGKMYQYYVLGLEESILLKWSHHPRQSTDSMQYVSSYQWYFFIEQEK